MLSSTVGLGIVSIPSIGAAQESAGNAFEEIRRIREDIARHREMLEQQQQRLWRLEQDLVSDGRLSGEELRRLRGMGGSGGAQQAQATPGGAPAPSSDATVGQADPEAERRRIDVAGVQEAGGILTPPGTFIFEPSLEYEQSSTNRFFFNGLEIVDTVLIGDIEVTDADRDSVTLALAGRYGLSRRAEIGVRIPYVYRSDRVTNQVVGGGETESDLDASDIGDIEVTGRYQLNSGAGGWPIFVGNLRVKSDTGKGPFDLDRDDEGIETELSTGSGFWAVQPGLTAVFPTDPAVLYGNVSYLWNIARDVNETVGGSSVGHVDPGDVVGFGFGIGFALNERASFSIGYDHNWVLETTTELDGVDVDSETLDVGSLNFGFSYVVTDDFSINVGVQAGITEDAPDVALSLRTPFAF